MIKFFLDSGGRALLTIAAVSASSRYIGGRAYDEDGALHVVYGTPGVNDPYLGGIAHTQLGAVYVSALPLTGRDIRIAGMRVTEVGQLYVDDSVVPSVLLGTTPLTTDGVLASSGSYQVTGSDYDGANDYAVRASDLVGAADGKQGTFSFSFRVDGGAGTRRTIFSTYNGGAFIQVELDASNKLVIVGNDGTATRLSLTTAGTFAVGPTLHHAMLSYDLATAGARHLYVNGASDLVVTTFTNNTLDYTTGRVAVGALASDGSLKWNGALSEVYAHFGVSAYIDLSVEENREKFITARGLPALGINGISALGVQPLLYAPSGNPATNNIGTGGSFTEVGAPTTFDITTFEIVPSFLADNGYSDDLGEYYDASAFSRLVVETEATAVKVGFYVDPAVYALGAQYSKVGVWDGATFQAIQPSVAGWNTGTLSLAAGDKTVQVINGTRVEPGWSGPDATGSNLVYAVFYDAASLVPVSQPANRILVYGDSITNGGLADPVTTYSWAMQLRRLYADTGSVMLESFNGRDLNDDGADASARTTFVSRIASYEPTIVWLAIGANDYFQEPWSADDFQTAYADFLDKLHAALPSAAIYAQTPIVMLDETANVHGDTLGDYRTAISNACSGRAWVTLVDGSAFVTTGDLPDGLHPDNDGNNLIYLAVAGELGISPGSLQFSASNYNVNDNAGSVTVTVTRTSGSVGAVTVNYATSDGVATQPADYTATSGTLSWADGETANKTFQVPIVNDLDAVNQAFNLTLSVPTGNAVIGAQGTATVTIVPSI